MPLVLVGKFVSLLLLLLALTGVGCKGRQNAGMRDRAQGDVMLQAGQFEEAAEFYRLAIAAGPHDAKLLERRAYALLQTGRIEEAAEELLRSQDLLPDPARKAETLRNVAYVYLKSTTPEEAERYFQQALELKPDDTESLMWLGELASSRGGARSTEMAPISEHLEKAIAYYDQVLALDPDSLLATVNKRIAVMKLISLRKDQKEDAERVLAVVRKDATRNETRTKAAQYDQQLAELQSRSTLLAHRIKELRQQGKTLQP
jgi:tetratricopeptide (TPR) repeat protein